MNCWFRLNDCKCLAFLLKKVKHFIFDLLVYHILGNSDVKNSFIEGFKCSSTTCSMYFKLNKMVTKVSVYI